MDKSENQPIFLIIPAFNEASVIAGVVLPLAAEGYSVVVVDDGSTDDTWSVLTGLPVVRVRHPINLGQGAALQTGMEYASSHGAEVIVHFDADGQHDSAQIGTFVAPIRNGDADVVLGSRFLRDSDLREVPVSKRFLLRGGRVFSGLMTGIWLTDTHNGFRALSSRAAAKINLRENGFAHATEILSQIRSAKLRYIELPTTIRYSDYARSKGQRPLNSLNIVVDLVLRKLFP